jgi:hypothetical protein
MIHRMALSVSSTAIVLVMAALLLGASCNATTQANLHTTALSLKALNAQYKAAQPIMDQAYTQKIITKPTYDEWAAFAKAYETWFPQTYQIWQGAVTANDQVSQGNISAAITSMGARLTALTVDVIAAVTKGE